MAFKIGGTTVIDNSRNVTTGSTATDATGTGVYNNAGTEIANLARTATYSDNGANNCRGYLWPGNCQNNLAWRAPNGNWWTWGINDSRGAPITTNCNNGAYLSGNANCSTAFNAVSTNWVYDAYTVLSSTIKNNVMSRDYSHCNCSSGANIIGNCVTNCNCNCNC